MRKALKLQRGILPTSLLSACCVRHKVLISVKKFAFTPHITEFWTCGNSVNIIFTSETLSLHRKHYCYIGNIIFTSETLNLHPRHYLYIVNILRYVCLWVPESLGMSLMLQIKVLWPQQIGRIKSRLEKSTQSRFLGGEMITFTNAGRCAESAKDDSWNESCLRFFTLYPRPHSFLLVYPGVWPWFSFEKISENVTLHHQWLPPSLLRYLCVILCFLPDLKMWKSAKRIALFNVYCITMTKSWNIAFHVSLKEF